MKKESAARREEAPLPSAETYRRLALALPGAFESSHMGAPDFRIGEHSSGRIFATLAYGSKGLGTLKISIEQQAAFLAEAPEYFSAAPGGWGRMGMTLVRVDAPEAVLAGALSTAFHHVLSKQAKKQPGTAAKASKSRLQ